MDLGIEWIPKSEVAPGIGADPGIEWISNLKWSPELKIGSRIGSR